MHRELVQCFADVFKTPLNNHFLSVAPVAQSRTHRFLNVQHARQANAVEDAFQRGSRITEDGRLQSVFRGLLGGSNVQLNNNLNPHFNNLLNSQFNHNLNPQLNNNLNSQLNSQSRGLTRVVLSALCSGGLIERMILEERQHLVRVVRTLDLQQLEALLGGLVGYLRQIHAQIASNDLRVEKRAEAL